MQLVLFAKRIPLLKIQTCFVPAKRRLMVPPLQACKDHRIRCRLATYEKFFFDVSVQIKIDLTGTILVWSYYKTGTKFNTAFVAMVTILFTWK